MCVLDALYYCCWHAVHARLLLAMRLIAHSACSPAGLASCALTDAYLANPRDCYVTEVLGPACIAVTGAQANPLSLAGKHSLNTDHR